MKNAEKTEGQLVKELAELRQRIAALESSESRHKREVEELEGQLRQAQELESIGLLAGGMAHDFNNLLTAILGNIDLSRMYAEPGDDIYASLSEARKACMRAKALTERLITLSKGWVPMTKPGPLTQTVKDSANLAIKDSKCKCEFSIPDGLWMVEFNERQLKKAIRNLILNSVEAMSGRGIIKVSAQNMAIGGQKAESVRAIAKGKYVKISIQDRGKGISKEHLPRMFEPRFCAQEKGAQVGIGLGLATSVAIIKKHGGHIHVESEEGVGTTFHVYLPVPEKGLPDKPEAVGEPLTGKARVLFMDDEEIVRNVAGKMLEYLGYGVEFAKDGTEAIELYKSAKETGQPFEVVILDLIIPGGMGGKEAIQRLLEIDPEIKAVVSSGFSDDPIMNDYGKYGFSGVISKPYRIDTLDRNLKAVVTGVVH